MADTNTVVSGLLWHGNPRRMLDAARVGTLQLYTSAMLLEELDEVLHNALSLPNVSPTPE